MSAASGPQGIRPPGGRPWMYGRGRGLRFTQNSSSVDMKRRNRSVEGLEEKEELKKLQEENNFLKEKLKKEKEDHERTKIKYEKTRNELEEKNTKLTRLRSIWSAFGAAAEREEKEIKAVEKVESGESNISTEAASRLTYKQIERDQKKRTSQLEGKKLESASHLGMGLGGPRNVSHEKDSQEIRQVEASTKFREPSILDEESMSFGRRNNDAGDDDLSDLLGSKKVARRFEY